MVSRGALGAWCVLCVALFSLAQLPGIANTYYVSTTGSDSNDGSAEHPWATIDKGDRDNILNPGDEVVILAGTYDVSAGSGALSVAICNAFAVWLVRRYRLSTNGRHTRSASR